MQGLQQEGTEAAGRFLADPENRRQLLRDAWDLQVQEGTPLKIFGSRR